MIEVKRWFHSKENWLNIISLAVTMATFVLANAQMLGLEPQTAFYVLAVSTAVVNGGNILLRNKSNAVIGNKTEVAMQEKLPK